MIRLFTLFILSWILTVVVEGGAARLFFGIEKKSSYFSFSSILSQIL